MNPEPTRTELLDWDRRHYWHAFTQMAEYEPLIVALVIDRSRSSKKSGSLALRRENLLISAAMIFIFGSCRFLSHG